MSKLVDRVSTHCGAGSISYALAEDKYEDLDGLIRALQGIKTKFGNMPVRIDDGCSVNFPEHVHVYRNDNSKNRSSNLLILR